MIDRSAFGSLVSLLLVLVVGCAASPSGEVSPSYSVSPLASLPPKVKRGNEGWKPSKPLPNLKMSEEEKARYRKEYLESFGFGERTVDTGWMCLLGRRIRPWTPNLRALRCIPRILGA